MGNDITKNAGVGSDRFTKSVMVDLRKQMALKLEALRLDQARLKGELERSFSVDTYRKLNIINQHIEVTSERLKGKWLKGDYPQFVEISKAVGSKASN